MKKFHLLYLFIFGFIQAYLIEVYLLKIGDGSLFSNLLNAFMLTIIPLFTFYVGIKKYPGKNTKR